MNLNGETAYLIWTHRLHGIDIVYIQFDASQLGVEPVPGSLEVSVYVLIVSRTIGEDV